MAYSDFTIPLVVQRLGLRVTEVADLFGHVPEVELPPPLAVNLPRYLPMGLSAGTEKGRSEYLVAPMLLELKLLHQDRIALFSGTEFNVDPSVGLNGRCDFIIARDPLQLALSAPVCVLVEAKHEDIVAGVPQCLAEMVAARRFNLADGRPDETVYGAVTSGLSWRFLRLDGDRAAVDRVEYPIQQPRKIFGILTHIALGD